MSSDWVVRCAGVGKAFQIYSNYNDRLRQVLFGRVKKYYKEFWVLRDIDLEDRRRANASASSAATAPARPRSCS